MTYARCAVGISGNGKERRLVHSAVELVERFEGHGLFIHIVDLFAGISSEALAGVPEAPPLAGPSFFDNVADSEHLKRYVEEQYGQELPGDTWGYKVVKGSNGDELVDFSRKLDLLILGHHHMNPVLHFFAHTLDEKVLNRVVCKVLIVPE
jgi:nucleotide-binding universal stress UspA family protein